MDVPKLFVSYSWSDTGHEQWVVNLAAELRESGVDVILDKWDLREGHDAVAFMEQMVTDPEIMKVVIICDKKYAAKADGRAGGVGTETQIISREVYENQAQKKFVAVVCEKDEDGRPFLPTYYKSRIYIDLSEPDRYSEGFEKLLRWVFDKPLDVRPALGNMPLFLSESDRISLGTTVAFKRCVDALRNHKAYAEGALDEYCRTFSENLARFKVSKVDGEYDDAVIKNIEEFLSYRNEALQVFTVIAQYSPGENVRRVHRLFEDLIPYMNKPANATQWDEWDFDNFRFLIHELFLYALAILLKHDRIEAASFLLGEQYYLPNNSESGKDVMVNFLAFREPMRSLKYRNERLGLRRLSLRADLLKERCAGTGIDFRYLLQADFVAFMRAEIEAADKYTRWWPEVLIFLSYFNSPFEVFARSASKAYFDRAKILLSIDSLQELEPLLKSYQDGSRQLPRWEFNSFNPAALLGYEQLATRA